MYRLVQFSTLMVVTCAAGDPAPANPNVACKLRHAMAARMGTATEHRSAMSPAPEVSAAASWQRFHHTKSRRVRADEAGRRSSVATPAVG